MDSHGEGLAHVGLELQMEAVEVVRLGVKVIVVIVVVGVVVVSPCAGGYWFLTGGMAPRWSSAEVAVVGVLRRMYPPPKVHLASVPGKGSLLGKVDS